MNTRSTYQKPNRGRPWTRVTTGQAALSVAVFVVAVVALSAVGGAQ